MKNRKTHRVCIYALLDPDSLQVKYIGQTKSPGARYNNHLSGPIADNHPKRIWIDGLIARGKLPKMSILRIVPSSKANRAELILIRRTGGLVNAMHNGENALDFRRSCKTTQRGELIKADLPITARKQLSDLRKRTGLNNSIILAMAVDRMYREEIKMETQTYYINEEMLGSEGTEAQARRMVELLGAHGYDVEYGEAAEQDSEYIADKDWQDALDAMCAEGVE